jgi:hypothetical protein
LTPDEKRLLPPPEIIGEVRSHNKLWKRDGRRHLTWYIDIRMPDGVQRRLHASSRGVLRKRLLYFKTLDRLLINSLIPPGPAQTPKSEKTLARLRRRTEAKNLKRGKKAEPQKRSGWKEVTESTAPPHLTLMDLMKRRREAAKGAK